MKIDLTKKPEGATHINPHSGLWVKCLGGNSGSYQYFRNGEWEMGFGCMSNSYLQIAKPEPWTGDGLPPVGTACEYTSNGGLNWRETSVLFIDEQVVLLTGYPLYKLADPDIAFRPIRTSEQIAAEDREKEIAEFAKDIRIATGSYDGDVSRARLLYAAGYRKQVEL